MEIIDKIKKPDYTLLVVDCCCSNIIGVDETLMEMSDTIITCPDCGETETLSEILVDNSRKEAFEEEAEYDLSDNQVQFCKDAEDMGLDIDYRYSGRGMFGNQCPSVRVDEIDELTTTAKYNQDGMGLGYVLYAKN